MRERSRSVHPPGPDPDVGPTARGEGAGTLCGQGSNCVLLLGEPGAAWSSHDPRHEPVLGSGDGCRERPRDGRVHARRVVVQVPTIAPDSPFMANLAWGANRTSGTMLSWLFSGKFTHFPNLKIALSEGEIGWIPYFLDRRRAGARQAALLGAARSAVHGARGHRGGSRHDQCSRVVPQPRVRLLHRRCARIASIGEIGQDNIMCETDYPHSDSTWPDCIGVVKHLIGHLAEPVQYKILRGNRERLYRFTPAEPPVLTNA